MRIHAAALRLSIATLVIVILLAHRSNAAVTVFLHFSPQWSLNLTQATMDAGTTPFDASEQSQIETNIVQQFSGQLAAFDVTVTTTDPLGLREVVDFGAVTGAPTLLGQSGLNFLNTSSGSSSVFAANFGFVLETGEARATQIDEISLALAGTGLHELGHSFGLRHHAAYGDPRITPALYGGTRSLQNEHLMATGSTGVSEEERETARSFSQWSKVLMEAANNLTASPLPHDFEFTDAGDTPATATMLETTALAISQTEAALVFGELSEATDVDVFAFEAPNPMQLTAEVYAQGLLGIIDDFDSQLRVYDSDQTTVLASNDDVFYDGNLFDAGTMHETDSLLLNVPLPSAGTYYIEISSNGTVTDPTGGGFYDLIFAAAEVVPEPAHSTVWLVAVLLAAWRRDSSGQPGRWSIAFRLQKTG